MEYEIVMKKLAHDMSFKEESKDDCTVNSSSTKIVDSKIETNSNKFDNLLFFFRFMYDKIHSLYDHESLKSYKRPLE